LVQRRASTFSRYESVQASTQTVCAKTTLPHPKIAKSIGHQKPLKRQAFCHACVTQAH
jgi:hypothetical protein